MVHSANLQYTSRRWTIVGNYEYVGKNYNAEAGYVPRHGYIKLYPQMAYTFFPKSGKILTHGPVVNMAYYFNPSFKRTDNESILTYLITYRSKSQLLPFVMHDYVQLLFPFDPTNSHKDSLAVGSRHRWNTVGVDYVSKPQSLFTYSFGMRYGGYYADGHKFTITNELGYRFQPYVNLSLSTSFNQLDLPAPWGRTNFLLIGPKVDVTFTNKLFFTTYVQYNQQLKNTNINARLQWRYKPASDLFIVYTDNYLTAPFWVRNRALVLKFNYWWSL